MAINKKLKDLINNRINNFLGYGDPNSSSSKKIWLIGMEEGADEKKREEWYPNRNINPNKLEEYYTKWFKNRNPQESFGVQKDTEYSFWDNKFYLLYGLLLFLKKGDIKGKFNSNKHNVEVKKLAGTLHKETLLLEFNPIPFRKPSNKKNALPREKRGTFLWEEYIITLGKNPLWKFLTEISEKRINLIKNNIIKYHPKIIIFYGLSYKDYYLNKKLWGSELKREFKGENIGSYRNGNGYNLYHSNIEYKDSKNDKAHKTHIFIIPHCSDPSAKKYPLIGKRILELLK